MMERRVLDLHEDHKEEAEVHGQVKQVTNKLQVESIYWLRFPLTFHYQISDIEAILHNNRQSCSRQNHIPATYNLSASDLVSSSKYNKSPVFFLIIQRPHRSDPDYSLVVMCRSSIPAAMPKC